MLTKENSTQIKGVAIFCMIAFHLFGYPERLPNDAVSSWFGSPLTKALQICVPIYLFIAGYGLQCIAAKGIVTWRGIIRRLLKLYISFWWIIIPFIVLGISVGYYNFNIKEFICNATGMTSSYNGEWWFFSLYVELVLLFYFISRIRLGWRGYLLLMIVILIITRCLVNILPLDGTVILQRHLKMVLIDLNIFMLGCFFSKFDVFGKFKDKYAFLFNSYTMAFLLVTFPLFVRAYVPMIGITELFTVPMFIIGLVNICRFRGGRCTRFLGKHSMDLWLIHSFFIYYYAKRVTFLSNIPVIMFITVLALSLACSIFIGIIRKRMPLKRMF